MSANQTLAGLTASVFSFVLGLAVCRTLFEGLFPRALWLGQRVPALIIGGVIAFLGLLLWRYLSINLQTKQDPVNGLQPQRAAWSAAVMYLPLSLNLFYLVQTQVDLAMGRMLLFSSLWLVTLFLSRGFASPRKWRWLGILLLLVFMAPIYLLTMGQNVGQADTFEFQLVVPQLGIVHPTGYPLFMLVTKLFTIVPVGSMAWRVNLGTAVYGLAAVSLFYLLGWRLTGWVTSSLLASVILGLIPVFWSQAIEAEVYTLHALIVLAALLVMREVGGWRLTGYRSGLGPDRELQEIKVSGSVGKRPYYLTVVLALILGLGLTNHLTTVILLPAAILTIIFAYRAGRYRGLHLPGWKALCLVIAAFSLPLTLYVYLPLRWAAVNGEPMGLYRFVDWVIGGRFQGALQLSAWLDDVTRYDIVGRLLSDQWPFFWTLVLILVGVAYLFLWQWRYALILAVTWAGYVFYALNYYVPDLSVFLIPAQIILALWWLCGLVAALDLVAGIPAWRRTMLVETVFVLAGIIPLLVTAADKTWTNVDKSAGDDRSLWATAVLDLPLPEGSAILADSDKYPPLYYLQQAEGVRPDLQIMVLPDEAAYRAALETRLAAGQPVFLARYLPGLEGIYHLNSIGPLIHVSEHPQELLPAQVDNTSYDFGTVQLIGYSIDVDSPYSTGESAVTLYWRAGATQNEVLEVYVRWLGESYSSPISAQHPANNSYPTVAWEVGEIITDYHALKRPAVSEASAIELQIALAPPFASADELEWQRVATLSIDPQQTLHGGKAVRLKLGSTLVDGVKVAEQVRPAAELLVELAGYGQQIGEMQLALRENGQERRSSNEGSDADDPRPESFANRTVNVSILLAPEKPGHYMLVASQPGRQARCGWFSLKHDDCILAEVDVAGVPIPDGATNFEDKIAFLSADIANSQLAPGGQLELGLTWQALASMSEDYTVFVQVLDQEDRIVGQVDSWPIQGTLPTSRWSAGEVIVDPYVIQLADNLEPGNYRLNIGWYLLRTLRRLQVIDAGGVIVDDKVNLTGLVVP